MSVLVVAAHPDDEVLGCGGTIAKLAREGREIHIAILGEGITSRYPLRGQADPALIKELHARSREAGRLLGAHEPHLYNLPDNRFDTLPLLDVVKIVEDLVERLRPEAIFTHHGGDLNIDHAVTCRAVLTATRPLSGAPVKEIYSFEVPSSTEWAFGSSGRPFMPNVFIGIADTLGAKLDAMQLYETELRPFPFPRSREALIAIAQRWGSIAGMTHAEAFCLIRSIR